MSKSLPGVRLAVACLVGGGLNALAAGWPAEAILDGQPAIAHPGLAQWAWLLQGLGLALLAWVLNRLDLPRPLPRGPRGARLRRLRLAQAALFGGLFALSWQLATVWWIHVSLHVHADMPAWMSAAAVLALGLYLAAYSAAAAALYVGCRQACTRRACGPWASALLFAATFLLAELGRGVVFTGFGWAALGHAHVAGPLRPGLPWVGAYGVGALSAFLAALAVGLATQARVPARVRGLRLAGVALALGLGGALADRDFTRSQGEMEVLLLQGNFDPQARFEAPQVREAVQWYFSGLKASFADLVMGPETAIPVLEEDIPPAFWAFVRGGGLGQAGALLIGMPQGGARGAPQHNVLVGRGHPDSLEAGAAQAAYRYEKQHLVPFAEFTPAGFAWFTAHMDMPLKTFRSGAADPPSLRIRTRAGPVQRVAPVICFEDLFGEEMALRFRDEAQAPTVIANASNMAWFEDTPAIAQHLQIARIRSLELQRPAVRATNTGATVIIDHQGRVTRALAPRTRDRLGGLVEGRVGVTPYAWWVSRTGLWPWLALALLGMAGTLRLGRRRGLRAAWVQG